MKIIILEGIDGTGKETQAKLLKKKLEKAKKKVKVVSFPRYQTPSGKIIKHILDNDLIKDPYTMSLYYAADRLANINELEEDFDYLILDRYVFSNMAYQGARVNDLEKFITYIEDLEFNLLKIPKPDQVFFLRYEKNQTFLNNRKDLDSYEKNTVYLDKVFSIYNLLVEKYNWEVIDCIKDGKVLSIDEINSKIMELIK